MEYHNFEAIEFIKCYAPEIVLMMPVKNPGSRIRKSLLSVIGQWGYKRKLLAIISDDGSTDSWEDTVCDLLKERIFIVLKTNQGSAAANRNYLLSIVHKYASRTEILLRLDGDDYLEHSYILKYVEGLFFSSRYYLNRNCRRNPVNMLLLGNTLSRYGQKSDRLNKALHKLGNFNYLFERLHGMAEGISEMELPSCNFIWKSTMNLKYPFLRSAEDHFLLVHSILKYSKNNFYFDEDEIFVNYSLSGYVTGKNKKWEIYSGARKFIFKYCWGLWKEKIRC